MKKTIGMALMFLIAISGAMAISLNTAEIQCSQAETAGYSCAKLDSGAVGTSGNVFKYQKYNPVDAILDADFTSYSIYILRNADDFDKIVNGNILSRNVVITKVANGVYDIRVDGQDDKNKQDIVDAVYGSTYLEAAKFFNAPTISYALTDFWNAIYPVCHDGDGSICKENPKPDTSLSGGATWTRDITGKVYADPLLG